MASSALEQQPSLEERKRHEPIDEKRELSGSEEGSIHHKEESYDGYDT